MGTFSAVLPGGNFSGNFDAVFCETAPEQHAGDSFEPSAYDPLAQCSPG